MKGWRRKRRRRGKESEAEREKGADKRNRPFAEGHVEGTQSVTL